MSNKIFSLDHFSNAEMLTWAIITKAEAMTIKITDVWENTMNII